MTRFPIASAVPLLAAACLIAGCRADNNADTSTTPAVESNDHGHHHDHPEHGPHGGDLVELGGGQYHAEVVHGDDGSVTVYILDATAVVVPIDAPQLAINVTHEGRPQQFTLDASPDATDPEGKSSRYVSTDAELRQRLHEPATAARLVVMIDGVAVSGPITHGHDHDH